MGMSLPSGDGGASRRGRRGRRSPPMSEINVTPFVDVMLVLLIIFMVAAPLLTVGVPLNLPKSNAKQLPQEKATPITVSVDAEGRIFYGEEEQSLAQLITRLGEDVEAPETDRVYLRADGDVGYGQVMRVMGELSSNGYANIGLVTDRSSVAPGADGGSDGNNGSQGG
ncbi:MAG: protein TolR [Pseudomonadota bacterium]